MSQMGQMEGMNEMGEMAMTKGVISRIDARQRQGRHQARGHRQPQDAPMTMVFRVADPALLRAEGGGCGALSRREPGRQAHRDGYPEAVTTHHQHKKRRAPSRRFLSAISAGVSREYGR
jgi:hypothetical protein